MNKIALLVVIAASLGSVEVQYGKDYVKVHETDVTWIRDEMAAIVGTEKFKQCLDVKRSSLIPDDPTAPISQPLVPHNSYIFQDVTVKIDGQTYQGTLVVNQPYGSDITGQFEFVLSIDGKRYWRVMGDINVQTKKAELLN
jgi:hypothetical protein